jgi:hypothetical protein
MQASHESLKIIRFEAEMLPNWAQLLDLAARLCPVSGETRSWFSRFTRSSGVDDARTAVSQSRILLDALRANKAGIIAELQRQRDDRQAAQICAAWEYALETMIQAASSRKTCAWQVEGIQDAGDDGSAEGDITLRRV